MNSILDAPVLTEQKLEYAGFWIRVVASIIDWVVLFIINMVLSFALLGTTMGMGTSDPGALGMSVVIYYLISLGIGISYYALMESSARQGTLGKMAVGIKVGDETGQRISGLNAVGRYLSKIISAIILCIGFIMVAFDVRKQGLHDKIASTTVFYG